MTGRTTNNKLPICKQCTTSIARGTESIACDGLCSGAFHATCAHMTTSELAAYFNNRNVWWICDHCIQSMRDMRDNGRAQRTEVITISNTDCNVDMMPTDCMNDDNRKLESIANEVSELKHQIASIHHDIAGLMSTRQTVLDSTLNTSSSPFSSTKLMYGSKRGKNSDVSCDTDASGKFWLFFTRIKNSTTESQMFDMISHSLGGISSESVVIRKLVPYWKDVSTMQFISYKVGVDPSLKHAALQPSTWPVGVCYRQFYNNVHTWSPFCE